MAEPLDRDRSRLHVDEHPVDASELLLDQPRIPTLEHQLDPVATISRKNASGRFTSRSWVSVAADRVYQTPSLAAPAVVSGIPQGVLPLEGGKPIQEERFPCPPSH